MSKYASLPTIIFFRNARTGSTSLKHAIRSSDYPHIFIDYKNASTINDLQQYKLIGVDLRVVDDPKKFAKLLETLQTIKHRVSFAVVRNPYTRFLSGYHRNSKKQRLAVHAKNAEYFSKHGSTYEKCLSNLPKKDEYNDLYNHITSSQTEKLYLNGKLIPDHLLKFENLQSEVTNFFKNNGYDLPQLEFANRSRNATQDLSKKSIALINRIYHDDFINFGYQTGYSKLPHNNAKQNLYNRLVDIYRDSVRNSLIILLRLCRYLRIDKCVRFLRRLK